ncbi:4-hydroxy-tetrahydrodipicolinate reductase [Elizabethkingia meningoseptica]|uniref:4-hydroxy-tetrahydrodipicolinate reductase n=1 Tax=Elizabethkingia meningoseptica TaxID=238 RepID=A0A1V3U2B1_ELIME|nr:MULTISPECIES: 4-hydroxy-tetrahydrodipicolinate reductase [Elizabethkingia]AQX13823.1 4-hydroxy-tetrahydrodipicolinate reductase [Elizabethkingia meningoseptica]MBG0515625.1 4-hydroxy-tetrahydrodipicolinate reductase [Elizabethkingia meningoseptica]MDE5429932.1 4-hydroxy-tetrahydrodipicolinate reductase [Elizabethkingia meningoseptica]MDE5434008.1 4-hydroxy-tetrahydrodipicolinate reductase [Elizabethkingia meningoseptica]MDE5470284.1 4-hydroxy-tetrahydrodipicolinate reductase [Elizabethkingi
MRIALVGYGKMGKIIDEIAQKRGHEVVARLKETPTADNLNNPDVVIEFSNPEAAYQNIKNCLELGIPVICGTTGWLDKKEEIETYAVEKNTAFLYGSNFSLGVNLFFALNERLAKMMSPFPEYNVQLEEIHHIHKLDAPSGTAITLAEGVIENSGFEAWKLEETKGKELGIFAIRENEVPGTHSVYYRSEVDEIEIKHTAFNRNGFALGAVVASEWINGKKGVFTMNDVLGL